jgi:hypothetical protein
MSILAGNVKSMAVVRVYPRLMMNVNFSYQLCKFANDTIYWKAQDNVLTIHH